MTETNLFQEVQEDLDRKRMEALAKRYGGWVMAAAVAVILGTAAFTGWQSWQIKQHQQSTGALLEIIGEKEDDPAKKIAAYNDFADHDKTSTAAYLAWLQAAALEDKQGHADKAAEIYSKLYSSQERTAAVTDPAFRQFAELMAVREQMDTAKPADLQARLQVLAAKDSPWRASAMEYQGYLMIKTGDKESARKIFTELSQDASVPKTLSERAADMLRYLGG